MTHGWNFDQVNDKLVGSDGDVGFRVEETVSSLAILN